MDQLSKYFKNELSEKEQETITKKLLQSHFDNQSKEKWQRILEKEYQVSSTQKNKAIKTKLFLKVGLIAASILLVLFIGNFYSNFSNQIISQLDTQELLRIYLAEKYDHPSLKKGLKEDDIRTKATYAYISGEYKKAIDYYQQIPDLKSEDLVFKGLSFLYDDQPDLAIPLLQQAVDLVPFDGFRVSEEIRWQLSLAYLKNEQFEKAKTALEQLANNKSGKRQKDAATLLVNLQQ